jgi:ribonuclease-3
LVDTMPQSSLINIMLNFFKKIFLKKEVSPILEKQKYKYESLYEKIGFFPKSEELIYNKALTHSSYNKVLYEKNERLEFLGDAVLNYIIAEILYEKFEHKNEGQLTKLRSNIVSRKYLNEIGFNLELQKFLKHKLNSNFYETSPDILGNTFEALIGAYYVDLGIEITKKIIYKILVEQIDFPSLISQAKDRKSFLFEWSQAQKKTLELKHTNKATEQNLFHVEIYIDDIFVADGSGKNKKEAEQKASEKACAELKI